MNKKSDFSGRFDNSEKGEVSEQIEWMGADRLSLCVVASRVSFACATLMLHLSLRSSGVVLEWRPVDMNVRVCWNS